MKAYSQDLRQRILDTVQGGDGTLGQIARRFLVSVSFITRLLQLHRSTGSLEPRPHGGGNPAVLGPEDLDGDLPLELAVVGAEDARHAAGSHELLELVAVGDQVARLRGP